MKVTDLTKADVAEALRICSRREKCTGCKMLLTDAATRRICFSALQSRAAELLEEKEVTRE